MVKEGIILGHKISKRGIEVGKAKLEVIEKLSPPTNVQQVRSFLGHAGFYKRFIKDFSQITSVKSCRFSGFYLVNRAGVPRGYRVDGDRSCETVLEL